MVLPKRACYPTTYILIVHTYHSLLLYSTIFPLAELYHQRQAPQTFYPHPGVIPNSMSHGNIIRSHCSTFVSGSAAAAAAASSAGGLGGSNSEIMALNASMLTSTNGNNGSNNTTTDFGVGVPTLMQQPHASILRSSVDNLLSQQHPMMVVISFQIFLKRRLFFFFQWKRRTALLNKNMKNAVQKCCMCSGFCIKQVWCLQLISLYISRHNYYVLISNFQNTEILSIEFFLQWPHIVQIDLDSFFCYATFLFFATFYIKEKRLEKRSDLHTIHFTYLYENTMRIFFENFSEHTT